MLPKGWRDRVLRYDEPQSGVVAWCVEPNDLWVSKAIAGRPKDREFCVALLELGFVDPHVLRDRVTKVAPATDVHRLRAESWIDRSPGS